MSEEELKKKAAEMGISVEEARMKLLGNGAAKKAALTLKDRKRQLDDAIAAAGG